MVRDRLGTPDLAHYKLLSSAYNMLMYEEKLAPHKTYIDVEDSPMKKITSYSFQYKMLLSKLVHVPQNIQKHI